MVSSSILNEVKAQEGNKQIVPFSFIEGDACLQLAPKKVGLGELLGGDGNTPWFE